MQKKHFTLVDNTRFDPPRSVANSTSHSTLPAPENTVSTSEIEEQLMQYYPRALQNAPQPSTIPQSEYFNYLAIQLLEEAGNTFPTQEAIDFVESLLERQSGGIS